MPKVTRRPAESKRPARRTRVNLTVLTALIDEARSHKLNLSRFLEDRLQESLRNKHARQWQEENREAIEHFNRRIERDGPLNADLLSF